VTLALTVVTTDVADALMVAWDAFRSAARDDLTGWEVTAAAAEVRPEPSLTSASDHTERRSLPSASGQAVRARGRRPPSRFIPAARASMSRRSCPVIAIVFWASMPTISPQRQAVLADLDERRGLGVEVGPPVRALR
jgi:hypothetical protein